MRFSDANAATSPFFTQFFGRTFVMEPTEILILQPRLFHKVCDEISSSCYRDLTKCWIGIVVTNYKHHSDTCFPSRSFELVQIRWRVLWRRGCHRGSVCANFSAADDALNPSLPASKVLQKSNTLNEHKNSLEIPSSKLCIMTGVLVQVRIRMKK